MIIETNDAAVSEGGGKGGMWGILVNIVMCKCVYACVMCEWQTPWVWGRDDWQRISER